MCTNTNSYLIKKIENHPCAFSQKKKDFSDILHNMSWQVITADRLRKACLRSMEVFMRAAVANIQNTQPDRFRVIISSRHLFSMSAKDVFTQKS